MPMPPAPISASIGYWPRTRMLPTCLRKPKMTREAATAKDPKSSHHAAASSVSDAANSSGVSTESSGAMRASGARTTRRSAAKRGALPRTAAWIRACRGASVSGNPATVCDKSCTPIRTAARRRRSGVSLRDAVESPAAAARVTLSRVSALEREPCREVAAGVGCMLLGAWLLAGAWLLERSAAAAESGAFSAPPECGDRRAWLGAVRARLPPLLQTHPLLDTFSLRIERLEDGEYAGEIGAAGAALEGARSVRGETCADVFD